MLVNVILILTAGFIQVQCSYEKKGILENTVSRVLQKVPILGQRINEMRDSSCSICAKQALQQCPLEILKSINVNRTEPTISHAEIHHVLKPGPHRFMGLMKNIVSKMHTQSRIDWERARDKEEREKAKKIGDTVIDTLNILMNR